MKTALQTAKDEYGVSDPEAEIRIRVSRFAEIMKKFAIEGCEKQKEICKKEYIRASKTHLSTNFILNAPLPKHLKE